MLLCGERYGGINHKIGLGLSEREPQDAVVVRIESGTLVKVRKAKTLIPDDFILFFVLFKSFRGANFVINISCSQS